MDHHEKRSGRELFERVGEGDEQAVHEFRKGWFDRFVGFHLNAQRKKVEDLGRVDREWAIELANLTMERVWQVAKRGTYRGEGSFSNFMFGIAHNVFREEKVKRIRWAQKDAAQEEEEREAVRAMAKRRGGDPETVVQREALGAELRECIRRLPPEFREPLYLHFFEELTYEEIGERLGILPATAKTRVWRAIHEKLRRFLPEEFRRVPVEERRHISIAERP